MNLLRDIVSSVWMLSESEAQTMLPIINQLIAGGNVDLSGYSISNQAYGYTNPEKPESKRVVVIPVIGTIMKYDYCGDMGMISFERILDDLRMDDSIGAVVLDIDSGGGQATYLDHVATAMRALRDTKPVLTHFSSICASAAYYIASQSTKIYASSPTDRVGSAGTMFGLRKPNENTRGEYVLESIYATKSTAKNHAYEEALKGNTDPIQKDLLDPINEAFHNDLQLGRPQLDQSVLDGRDVMASEGIKLGLIDGIKRLDKVISEAFTLIQQP